MIDMYVELFNIIFDKGIFPDSWVTGVIKPIYKKGDHSSPDNYRPITLISYLSKLFTSLLNNRLTRFIEDNEALSEVQAGFRKSYSTVDHTFSLSSIIDLLKYSNKKLYCAFIDFSKAFDSVWRVGLWMKLINHNIKGKYFKVIYNMYQNIRSCICNHNMYSDYFPCSIGVRQGENLSPLLFSLFLNDLEEYLTNSHCKCVQLPGDNDLALELYVFIVLLYADDTVLMADNAKDLQRTLDAFSLYGKDFKLHINTLKSQIVIFGGRKQEYKTVFTINSYALENVNQYKYLGIIFTKTNNFSSAKKEYLRTCHQSDVLRTKTRKAA
jgi:hypothetical protein